MNAIFLENDHNLSKKKRIAASDSPLWRKKKKNTQFLDAGLTWYSLPSFAQCSSPWEFWILQPVRIWDIV